MIIREARAEDFEGAIVLYQELVGDWDLMAKGETAKSQWSEILQHPGTTVFAAEKGENIVGLVTLHLLPNLTFGSRPYALIENVVAAKKLHGQGVGRKVMEAAMDHAWKHGAYKIMLLTGTERGAKGFYEKLGFNAADKHGMIIWKD